MYAIAGRDTGPAASIDITTGPARRGLSRRSSLATLSGASSPPVADTLSRRGRAA